MIMSPADVVWYLRIAAFEWLKANPDDPNAKAVRDALKKAEYYFPSSEVKHA